MEVETRLPFEDTVSSNERGVVLRLQPIAATGSGSRICATVWSSPNAESVGGPPPLPKPLCGGVMSTASPLKTSFVTVMPSVISGMIRARITFAENTFWSRRSCAVPECAASSRCIRAWTTPS